jgi:hypothetical protein
VFAEEAEGFGGCGFFYYQDTLTPGDAADYGFLPPAAGFHGDASYPALDAAWVMRLAAYDRLTGQSS